MLFGVVSNKNQRALCYSNVLNGCERNKNAYFRNKEGISGLAYPHRDCLQMTQKNSFSK